MFSTQLNPMALQGGDGQDIQTIIALLRAKLAGGGNPDSGFSLGFNPGDQGAPGAGGLSVGMSPGITSGASPVIASSLVGQDPASVAAYWTPERMASASPRGASSMVPSDRARMSVSPIPLGGSTGGSSGLAPSTLAGPRPVTGPGLMAPGSPGPVAQSPGGAQSAAEVAAYWTPERMASAGVSPAQRIDSAPMRAAPQVDIGGPRDNSAETLARLRERMGAGSPSGLQVALPAPGPRPVTGPGLMATGRAMPRPLPDTPERMGNAAVETPQPATTENSARARRTANLARRRRPDYGALVGRALGT